jgi:ribonuclease R
MSKKNDKKKKSKMTDATLYKGTLDITRSGMGYVLVDKLETDILVRPNHFNTALNGDKVRVRLSGDPHKGGRKQGEIVEVIEMSQNFAFFLPETEKPMPDFYISFDKLNNAQQRDKVLVKLLGWEKGKKPHGEVVQVMQPTDINNAAMQGIIIENGFSISFPEEVIQAAENISDSFSPEEIERRKDVRPILTLTIDPADAKDFDDALSFKILNNGNYEIGVHIADVSHYVTPHTPLDEEAYTRATSVYLPDRVNPMLPERISNELCSLRPHEDKLTFSAIFQLTPQATVENKWLGKTIIHSNHRFTYEEVQQIIEGGEGPHKEEIVILNTLAQQLRKQRFEKGAINFSSQEVRFKLDETGKPIGIVVKESKAAHQLIEEFMLLANKTVAESVAAVKHHKKPIPFPYRIHDTPDKEKLLPFVEFAKKYGHTFDLKTPEGIARSFNTMLEGLKGKPEQHVLEQLGIRTMSKAIYTAENIGHYGLGFEYYTHFTSPIRRYPDVMVHRLLEEVLKGEVPIDKKMEEKCKHCSERERAAMDAERAANKYKQVQFMSDKLGEEFEGIISGVAAFGFWVETILHKCEGLVSINSLFDYDDFRHIESDYCLVGKRSGRSFRMGDKVCIKLVSANVAKRQLDYEWVLKGVTDAVPKTTKDQKRSKR